jgi:hypothetical protein
MGGSLTECRGRLVSIPILYSVGTGFNSRSRHRLSRLKFVVLFLSSSKKMLGQYLKLDHDRFRPYPFQFIILYHPVI